MASLSCTFVAPEATSAFLGTTLPKDAASAPARVSMAYSRQDLEKKPLALLRALARQQGVPITGKQAIIDSLIKKGQYSYSPDLKFSAPTSYGGSSYSAPAAGGGDANQYQSLSLGELRALARSRGVRGDTKAELIKALLEAPAPAAPSSASYGSSSNGAAAATGLPKEVLERKSLSELRALARARGLRGDTKAELVKLLAGPSAPSAPSNGASSYSSYASSSNGASNYSSYSNGAGARPPTNQTTVRQLATKSMSQLRAMAAVKGIRGTTKDELVRQLAAIY